LSEQNIVEKSPIMVDFGKMQQNMLLPVMMNPL